MTPNGSVHPEGSGPACRPCIAAETNPYSGEYHAGCFGCQVRNLSNLPQEARQHFYASIADLKERGAWAEAVATEYRRRKALMADRGVQ